MKYITIIIASVLFTLFTNNAQAQSKDKDDFLVKVDGLGCPFCAYGLEKKFKELKGMKNPKIDMETGKFTFTYPTEKNLTVAQVEKQVEAAGYTPVSVKITRADGSVENSSPKTAKIKEKGETVKASFMVAGNCGMCEARIEKAAKAIDGVVAADWSEETKQLKVEFAKAKVTQVKIEEAIAKVGHDTKTAKTTAKTYDNLPACCQYNRIK